jgi:FSR family fosmidomycin resistance protein-like MFS transporter
MTTPSSSEKTRALWLVSGLHAFTHIYHVALMPLYLLMQRDFKFDGVGQATSLMTVMMFAYFLPSFGMGVLADRVNRKKLLGFGLAINATGFIALALSPNYGCALASMIVAGIGGSFFHPAATAMIARMFPTGTGRALGIIGTGASIGFFIAPLYTGWRAAALEPILGAAAWRRPVLELGILGLIGAAVFAWLATNDAPASVTAGKPTHSGSIFPTRSLWLFFFASAVAFSLRDFTGAAMGSMGSLFLQKAHGFDSKLAGFALSGIFIFSAFSNPIFGHFSDSGRKKWLALVLVVAAVMVAIFPHVPKWWTIPIFIVYGFFFMASYPMVEAALMESVPDAVRGRVFGLFITIGGLISNSSHWIAGNEVKRMGAAAYSPGNYFWLYGMLAGLLILSLVGLPCLHAIRKREHLEQVK